MGLNSLNQIAGSSIVEEKDPLPDTPERSRSKLIRPRSALSDAVCQPRAHVMDQEIREEIRSLVGQGRARTGGGAAGNHRASHERRRVALGTSHAYEGGPSIHSGRRVGRRRGWRQHSHEVGKRLDV
jgi:hypothetical protein